MAMGLLSKVVSDKVSGKVEANAWNEPPDRGLIPWPVVISKRMLMKATTA